ncbi:MAG: endonuclease/exonuclease/phosphatase family protein [Clostridia bacterium]|nr:endonuclease/exonuclease/phosphatase family protein [Clostridia bacterium]
MSTIRLMTHNIWNRDKNSPAWEEKGFDCSAEARIGGLLRVWQETEPDVIGCQESSALMADLVKEGMPGYTLIWGRFTPILYRADKLELVDSEFFTYPDYIEGFEGKFNDARSKAYNIGVFRVKESGKLFIFATTHLWWKRSPSEGMTEPYPSNCLPHSDEAREYQIDLLTKALERFRAKYNCPTFLVGDLNTGYESKAVQSAFAKGFRHAHDIATDYAEEAVGYHYCFPDGFKTVYSDRPFKTAIDHILVIGEEEGSVKRFERYSPDYYYPISDHSPAFVDVELSN